MKKIKLGEGDREWWSVVLEEIFFDKVIVEFGGNDSVLMEKEGYFK